MSPDEPSATTITNNMLEPDVSEKSPEAQKSVLDQLESDSSSNQSASLSLYQHNSENFKILENLTAGSSGNLQKPEFPENFQNGDLENPENSTAESSENPLKRKFQENLQNGDSAPVNKFSNTSSSIAQQNSDSFISNSASVMA